MDAIDASVSILEENCLSSQLARRKCCRWLSNLSTITHVTKEGRQKKFCFALIIGKEAAELKYK